MKLQSFLASRPGTNLISDSQFSLPKEKLRSRFLGVFTKAYPGDARKTLLKLAVGSVMDATTITMGRPARPTSQEERQALKQSRARLREWENARSQERLDQFTILRKVNGDDPHFVLSLPIFKLNSPSSIDVLLTMFGSLTAPSDAIEELRNIMTTDGDHNVPASLCLERSHLDNGVRNLFAQSLIGGRIRVSSSSAIFYLDFKILAEEAENLVSSEWLEIRPVDLYPLFTMWVESEYESRLYGKSAISMSKIANTLPTHDPQDERIDEYNISINMAGEPLWIPRTCNNTEKYESMFTSAGASEGDEFALRKVGDIKIPVLPSNIPILVDWVNNKFTYSTTSGKPAILQLEHFRKCNASMALNVLNRPMPATYLRTLVNYAAQCKVEVGADKYGAPKELSFYQIDSYHEYMVRKADKDREGFTPRFVDLTEDTDNENFRPVVLFVRALYEGMVANLDALYAKYAVITITEALGMVSVIANYGRDMATTRAKSDTICAAAANQGIDPNWTPPDAPLITKKFSEEDAGFIPHQAKIRNLLRESPDFAVLSVAAGGGKSMLSITDILYEIKANRNAPYMIGCPSHLVANYVSELVEFTDGQVNVIPITSYNIRVTGIKRYEEILSTAPINTVIVFDYDALKFRGRAAVYGTTAVAVYPVIEMLRKFKPGYVMLDESHFLRNPNSARFKSVMSLIADVPKKRIASGTLNPDSPSDLPGQLAILDPTILGSREDFNSTYGEDVRGGRVMKWRTSGPNSINSVMSKIKSRVVWAQAQRKEWACALPPRQDRIIPVDLSEAQREVYDAIFDDMVQQIRKDAENNANAKKLLLSLEGKKASAEDEHDFGDLAEETGDTVDDLLDDSTDVGPGLQPYLVDIERFVTDPTSHPYAKNGFVNSRGEHRPPLSGEDLMPPKARALKELLEDHDVLNPNTSKVLVFVNYNQSAESLFAAMPPEIQAAGILYKASSKTEMVNRFKTDPKVKWMIGIRKSLEVGLNLQQAGYLIRIEGVWTPGEQEQGDSRIARPYFGPGGDKRPVLKFDTIVANRTIDITKTARLRAKMIAVAKFENVGNPNYESIEDIPIIPMTLDAITTQNDFETNLAQYQTSMAQLNRVIKEENEEYKQKILAEGGFKFTQVKKAPPPAEAALLARVPYAQGTELYAASELGLVRVDNYLGMELSQEGDSEDDGEEDTKQTENSAIVEQRNLVMNLRCHTEFGDGTIIGASGAGNFITRVKVALDDGTTVMARVTNAFIVTRSETNGVDMRNKLAQAAGLNVTAPITVPGAIAKQTRVTQKMLREQERQRQIEEEKKLKERKQERESKKLSIELQLNLINGYMQVAYIVNERGDPRAVKALEALGFKMNPQYYFTRIRTFKHLITQARLWADGGFEITNQVDNDTFQALAAEFASGGVVGHRHYSRLVNEANFRNYMRAEWKPNADRKALSMFALVTDGGHWDAGNLKDAEKLGTEPTYGMAFLCLPAGGGHPSSKLAISSKYKAPATRWLISTPTLSRFVGAMNGVHRVIEQVRAAGIRITNVDDLNKYARSVKKVAPKVDETSLFGAD